MATTYERLKKIVVEQLGADEDEVKPEASFVDDLNADSLDLVELIMSLEEEFGTEISDEDAEKIRTVQDAVDYIDERAVLAAPTAPDGPRACVPPRPSRRGSASPSATSTCSSRPSSTRAGSTSIRDARRGHNERLEFLGDAVVNLAISEALYARHPDDDEGYLSRPPRRDRVDDRASPGWPAGSTSGRPCCSARARPSAAAAAGRRCWPRPSRRVAARSISTSASSRSATGSSSWPSRSSSPRRRSARSRAPRAGSRSTPSGAPGDRPVVPARSTRPGPDHEKSFRIEVWVDGEVLGRRRGAVAPDRRDGGRGRRRSSALRTGAIGADGDRRLSRRHDGTGA